LWGVGGGGWEKKKRENSETKTTSPKEIIKKRRKKKVGTGDTEEKRSNQTGDKKTRGQVNHQKQQPVTQVGRKLGLRLKAKKRLAFP